MGLNSHKEMNETQQPLWLEKKLTGTAADHPGDFSLPFFGDSLVPVLSWVAIA